MNLFEISNDYQFLLSNSFDPETGEVNEEMLSELDTTLVKVEDKSIAVASYIKNLDAEKKAIEEVKKSMGERERKLELRVEWLTNYLKSNMERCGINEIKSPYFDIKIKKCPVSVDIFDENNVPEDYKKHKQVISIDKTKIREELQMGVVIPGATLKQNTRLAIK